MQSSTAQAPAAPALASLDDVVGKPPAGVVLPPREIRSIVEKTAGYVARNGPVFEDRIRQKELQNPKFSFLNANDAYNAFYDWRLTEIREGRGTAVSAGRVGETIKTEDEEEVKPKGPEQPPELQFSARMPNMNALDLHVVQLTALFVAKNGRSFMTSLSQKEAGNFQFDFLRPQHSLYQFFSRLVDQYSELLNAGYGDGKVEEARIAELERNKSDKFHMLGRARQRAEWVKFQEQQKQQKEEAAEAERIAYAQVDWHDFVVVETVAFTDADEQADLPPPTSLSDLQSASLEQKAMMSLRPHNMRIEEAMPTDEDIPYFSQPPPIAMGMPPPTFHPTNNISNNNNQDAMDYQMQTPSTHEEEDRQRLRERDEAEDRAQQAQAAAKGGTGPMRIRNDYVPRAQAKRQNVPMSICPNCKQMIPIDEMEEHLRSKLILWQYFKSKLSSFFVQQRQ